MAEQIVETKIRPQLDPGERSAEFGVPVDLPFHAYSTDGTVINPAPVPIKDLVKMRQNDGQVRALMRALTLPIRTALRAATYEPDEGGEAEAEFIEQMLTLPPQAGGMSVSLHTIFGQMLLGLVDGFAAFEQVYQVPTEGLLANKITLRKLAQRPATSITFIADRHGGFLAMRQRTQFQGREIDVIIPAEDSFYFAAAEEENPFYGLSYFLPAFYHYDKKVKLYYVSHLAAQHNAVPGRIGKYSPSATAAEKQAFRKALGNFGVTGVMTYPDGFEVSELRSGSSTFPYVELINHHNQQMSKSVLAQFLDRNDEKALVDFAESETSLFTMTLQGIADDITGLINAHLIPKFIDWNFNSGKYPRMQITLDTVDTEKAVKEMFTALATAPSLNASPDFLHEMEKSLSVKLGLGIDYDELEAEFVEWKDLQRQILEKDAAPEPAPSFGPAFSSSSANTVSLSDVARQIMEDLEDADDS